MVRGLEKMKNDSKFVYDCENDIMFFAKKEKSYDESFEIENLVFDLDKNEQIVGLEILDASKLLGVDKVFLKNVFEGEMRIRVNKKLLQLKINLKSNFRNSKRSSVYKSDNFKPDFLNPSTANFALVSD